MTRWSVWAAVVMAIGLASPPVGADEAAEAMVDAALPHMYHTCASLLELADGDEAIVIDVVGKITAVSIYMRRIDISDHAATDADREALREAYLASVARGCNADQDALLAGIIDNAVKETLGL